VTVRHAVLPIGALLVLGLGVYLFVEVRAQPAPPQIDPAARNSARPAPRQIGRGDATAAAAPSPSPSVTSGSPVTAVQPQVLATGGTHDTVAGSAQAPEPALTGPKLDAVMDEANKAYDRGDYEDAKTIAARLLATFPTNVRMLRIMVSASCIEGDNAVAQTHYQKLPPSDQEQMRVRCARYGVTFTDRP
jgi:hypothetical protein